MHAEVALPVSLVVSFVLVLARISGVLIFIPLPGIHTGFEMVRVIFSVVTTLALFPRWPVLPAQPPGMVELAGWLVLEAGMGITAGLAIGFVTDAFMLGAQILSLQAGFSYASMVDPNTQAESGVLPMLAQFLAGLLFFSTGLDRQVIAAFARSLETFPPGTFTITRPIAEQVLHLGSSMFSTALRLVLPLVGLLVMVDIALALVGRLNGQLQMMLLAFPAKMLTTIAFLAWILVLYPKVFSQSAGDAMGFVGSLLRR
jgi:flagellar biosynthesis protein FliR